MFAQKRQYFLFLNKDLNINLLKSVLINDLFHFFIFVHYEQK